MSDPVIEKSNTIGSSAIVNPKFKMIVDNLARGFTDGPFSNELAFREYRGVDQAVFEFGIIYLVCDSGIIEVGFDISTNPAVIAHAAVGIMKSGCSYYFHNTCFYDRLDKRTGKRRIFEEHHDALVGYSKDIIDEYQRFTSVVEEIDDLNLENERIIE